MPSFYSPLAFMGKTRRKDRWVCRTFIHIVIDSGLDIHVS
jgi:hypothetical protein